MIPKKMKYNLHYDDIYTLILSILIFQSSGLSVQKKFKIDFQDGGRLRFLIKTNLAIFDLQVTQILPTKFRVNCPFVQEEKCKIDF